MQHSLGPTKHSGIGPDPLVRGGYMLVVRDDYVATFPSLEDAMAYFLDEFPDVVLDCVNQRRE